MCVCVILVGLVPCFLFGSVSEVVLFQEFVHFFQVVHFIGIELLVVVSHGLLYICGVSCNLSFFISNFTDLSLLSFSLDESG